MLKFILIFAYSLMCAQNNAIERQSIIAKIKNNFISYSIDTITYKEQLAKQIKKEIDVEFSRIEIKRQKALGSGKEFYYILLTDKKRSIRVAKWLNKIDDGLYINDVLSEGHLFEQVYLICIGEGSCDPNVFEDKDIRMWGCSDIYGCGAVTGKEPECKVMQSILQFN